MSTVMTIGKRVEPKMKFVERPPTRTSSFTVYAHMTDMNDLQHAVYLDNREFYYVDLDERYRDIIEMMVIDISGLKFELVTRKFKPDKVTITDTTTEVNADTFNALRGTSSLGFKHKYLQFPVVGTAEFWEVSVFLSLDGSDHPWVKLDLYTDNVENIKELPFPVKRFIVEADPSNPPEDSTFIKRLWSREYSRIDTGDVIKR